MAAEPKPEGRKPSLRGLSRKVDQSISKRKNVVRKPSIPLASVSATAASLPLTLLLAAPAHADDDDFISHCAVVAPIGLGRRYPN